MTANDQGNASVIAKGPETKSGLLPWVIVFREMNPMTHNSVIPRASAP